MYSYKFIDEIIIQFIMKYPNGILWWSRMNGSFSDSIIKWLGCGFFVVVFLLLNSSFVTANWLKMRRTVRELLLKCDRPQQNSLPTSNHKHTKTNQQIVRILHFLGIFHSTLQDLVGLRRYFNILNMFICVCNIHIHQK